MSTCTPVVRWCVPLAILVLAVPAWCAEGPTTAPARSSRLGEMREQERTTRGLLREVEEQLNRLSEQSLAPATAPAESSETRQRRAAALNDLKKKYQFRLDELKRELRERAARLSIDGMGVSGGLSTREVEMTNLLTTQFDVSRNANDTKHAYDAAMALVNRGEELPSVRAEIGRDSDVQAARKALVEAQNIVIPLNADEAQAVKKKVELAQRRADDAVAEVRARVTATILEGLRQQKDATEAQQKTIAEKVDAAKADLGEVTNALNGYLTVKDDEQATRGMLRKVDEQLAQLEVSEKSAEDAGQARRRAEEQLQSRSVQLNNLKTKYQFRLDELRREIDRTETEQAAGMFAGTVDVYLSPEEVSAGKPSLSGVTFDGMGELGGRQFVRLKNDRRTWSIDPSRIVAVCSSGGTSKNAARP